MSVILECSWFMRACYYCVVLFVNICSLHGRKVSEPKLYLEFCIKTIWNGAMKLLNFSFEPSRIEIFLETCFSKVILRNFHLFEKNLSYEHFHVKVGVYICILCN